MIQRLTVPFRFHGLYAIGLTVFLFILALFALNVVLITTRFFRFKHTFRTSFLHPTESLFTPVLAVSVGTILLNVEQYGLGMTGKWLETAVLALF